MDIEARQYENQLHQANQERMGRFEDKLDRTLKVVVEIGEAIKCIPAMEQRIKDLESERDQRKGANQNQTENFHDPPQDFERRSVRFAGAERNCCKMPPNPAFHSVAIH